MFNVRLRGSPCCLFAAAEINLEQERRGEDGLALQCRSSNEEEGKKREREGGRERERGMVVVEGGSWQSCRKQLFSFLRGRFRDSLLVWKSSRRTRCSETS